MPRFLLQAVNRKTSLQTIVEITLPPFKGDMTILQTDFVDKQAEAKFFVDLVLAKNANDEDREGAYLVIPRAIEVTGMREFKS